MRFYIAISALFFATCSLHGMDTLEKARFFKEISKGNLEQAKSITNKNEQWVEYQNKKGLTPLMIAAKEGALPIVKWLIESGAQVNKKTKSDDTAWSFAIENWHWSVVHYLEKCKADVDESKKASLKKWYDAVRLAYKPEKDGSVVEYETMQFIQIDDKKNHQKLRLYKGTPSLPVFPESLDSDESLYGYEESLDFHNRVERWFEEPQKAAESDEYFELRKRLSKQQIIENHNFAQVVDQYICEQGIPRTFTKHDGSEIYGFCIYGLRIKGDAQERVCFEYGIIHDVMIIHRLMRDAQESKPIFVVSSTVAYT